MLRITNYWNRLGRGLLSLAVFKSKLDLLSETKCHLSLPQEWQIDKVTSVQH